MSDNKVPKINLTRVPKDVHDYIMDQQCVEKKKCNCHRSKEFTVYAMLRELKELKEGAKIFKK